VTSEDLPHIEGVRRPPEELPVWAEMVLGIFLDRLGITRYSVRHFRAVYSSATGTLLPTVVATVDYWDEEGHTVHRWVLDRSLLYR
jgi:hypothetical protein